MDQTLSGSVGVGGDSVRFDVTPDGRVDAQGRTLKRLNHIAGSGETRGNGCRSVEPLTHVRQFTDRGCRAASGTMLVGARDRSMVPVDTVMNTADATDPGPRYMNLYQNDRGLAPADTGRYVKSIGLRVGPPMNLTLQGWRSKLAASGAIGVVGLMPFVHVRVVSEMKGDGSVFGTFMTIHDPLQAGPSVEVFATQGRDGPCLTPPAPASPRSGPPCPRSRCPAVRVA